MGPNTELTCERTIANPNLGATLIRYARTGCMGGNSIERQDDAMDAWLCARGLEADEEITELAKGTRVNEGLESVLRRAEAGERILVIAARPDRISRDAVALAEFVRRAAACGLDLQFVRG
jgi:DNA invertase Pin-like site-specific DNA recombinase